MKIGIIGAGAIGYNTARAYCNNQNTPRENGPGKKTGRRRSVKASKEPISVPSERWMLTRLR